MSGPAYISARDLSLRWDRCKETITGWCKAGLIPGACKCGLGKMAPWRIPLAWVAEAERKTIKQLAREVEAGVKERKRETWNKLSGYLEKAKDAN